MLAIEEMSGSEPHYDRNQVWDESQTFISETHIKTWEKLEGPARGRDLPMLFALGLSDRKSFRERYLKPAVADGLIEITIPDKPNSSLQKYRLTDKCRQWLAQHRDG